MLLTIEPSCRNERKVRKARVELEEGKGSSSPILFLNVSSLTCFLCCLSDTVENVPLDDRRGVVRSDCSREDLLGDG